MKNNFNILTLILSFFLGFLTFDDLWWPQEFFLKTADDQSVIFTFD